MTRIFHLICISVFSCIATAAVAQSDARTEIPRGLWQGAPDAQGISFHVRTRRCGTRMCGRVERVKNRRGIDAPSNAVGQKVLWELNAQTDGSFLGEYRDATGMPWPDTRVELRGNALRLRMCDVDGCREEIWKRLR